MLPNRIAAGTQAVIVPVVMITAQHQIAVSFIQGPFSVVLGAAYVGAAVVAFIWAGSNTVCRWIAGIGATWWVLRAATLLVDGIKAHQVSWAGIAIQAGWAVFVILYYWRSIVRGSFLTRWDQITDRLNA